MRAGSRGTYSDPQKHEYRDAFVGFIAGVYGRRIGKIEYAELCTGRAKGIRAAALGGVRRQWAINYERGQVSQAIIHFRKWGLPGTLEGYAGPLHEMAAEHVKLDRPKWDVLNADFCGTVSKTTTLSWITDTLATGVMADDSWLGITVSVGRVEDHAAIVAASPKYMLGALTPTDIGRLRLVVRAIEASKRYTVVPCSQITLWQKCGKYGGGRSQKMLWAIFRLKGATS